MAIHEHGTPSVIGTVGEDGYCWNCRPDVAPPKDIVEAANRAIDKFQRGIEEAAKEEGRYLNEDELEVMLDGQAVDSAGKHSTDVNGAPSEPPPSDAAPVAQLLYDTMPDMISDILVENEIDPFVYAAKWAEAIGPLYAHPEDAEDDPFKELPPTDADEPPWKGWYSCEDCNGWFCGQPTCYENGVEVCPSCAEKRLDPEDAPEGPWEIFKSCEGWNVRSTADFCPWTETQAIAVRDVLNRLKGEGGKDGTDA